MRWSVAVRGACRFSLLVLLLAGLGVALSVQNVGDQRMNLEPSQSADASVEQVPLKLAALGPDMALVLDVAPASSSTWHSVARWAGERGVIETTRFDITGSEWRIVWQALGGSSQTACALAIYVYDDLGAFVALAANRPGVGTGESSVHGKPGRFYLTVVSCRADWDIAIEDYY
jgi:hypothetical protein